MIYSNYKDNHSVISNAVFFEIRSATRGRSKPADGSVLSLKKKNVAHVKPVWKGQRAARDENELI